MVEYHFLLLAIFTIFLRHVQSAGEIHKFGVDIRQFGVQFLEHYMNNEDFLEKTLQHGCWCKRISPYTKNMNQLGGSIPTDELDRICKDWFQAKVCTHYYLGGCYAQWFIGRYRYETYIDADNPEDSYCKSLEDDRVQPFTRIITHSNGTESQNITTIFNKCEVDNCLVDLYYTERINRFWLNNPDFQPFVVNNNDTCIKAPYEFLRRSCIGEAPDIKEGL